MTDGTSGIEHLGRRAYLGAIAAGVAAVAGCGGDGGGTSSPTSTATNMEPGTETMGNQTDNPANLGEHSAGVGLGSQPLLGNASTAEATIVAFEDPSCPVCRTFERDVVPQIRSNLVDTGKAIFAFRGYPVIYDWGEPAVHALEATFARDVDAHWALLEHYFAEQSAFGSGDVVDRTREFLANETSVDADAVATAAAERSETAAVQTDLDAGMDAGAGRVTPHLFLFKDGAFRTSASGSVSYELIAAALDL